MNKIIFAATLSVAVSVAFAAYDADTLAFYGFKDGAAGTSLAGVTIANDAGDSHSGALSLNGSPEESVTFSSDVPGRYVFDSAAYGATPLCADLQSVLFAGKSTRTGDQVVSFDGLGTAISQCDDFTIEFFFKTGGQMGRGSDYSYFFNGNCGLVYNPPDTATAAELAFKGTVQPFSICSAGTYGNLQNCVRSATYHTALVTTTDALYPTAAGKLADGLWHHYALVYSKDAKSYTVYLDYGTVSAKSGRTTEKQALEDSFPIEIGRGGYCGLLAGFRFSSCARTKETFLRCSNAPAYYPKTVFHFSMDGENGTNVASVDNVDRLEKDPFEGQYVGRGGFCWGTATARTWTDSESQVISPVYTNEIPKLRKTLVMAEGYQVCESTGSVRLVAKARTTEAYEVDGTGFNVLPANHTPIASGSFTLEEWFKFDWTQWKTKLYDTTPDAKMAMRRLALFGRCRTDALGSADLCLALYIPDSSGNVQVQLKATDSSSVASTGTYSAPSPLLKDGLWHHAAIVYDDTERTVTAYLDGSPVASVTMANPILVDSGTRYRFGYGLNCCGFEGLMDEIRLVHGALTPDEFVSFKRPPSGLMLLFR